MLSLNILLVLSLVSQSVAHVAALTNATCFGKDPDFDKGCAKYHTEAECDAQVACTWGEKGKTNCFAKNGDPIIDRACKKFTNETLCEGQLGCTWRSDADMARWVAAIQAAVSALKSSAPTIPDSIGIGKPTYINAHDHKEIAVADLPGTLSAWVTKYGLPENATRGLQALVAAESVDFKSYHVTLGPGVGVVEEFAAGGRNWGGVISLAFVHAKSTSTVTKYISDHLACIDNDHDKICAFGKDPQSIIPGCEWREPKIGCPCKTVDDCKHFPNKYRSFTGAEVQAISQQLQTWSYQKISAESILLKDEIFGPSVLIV